MKKHIWSISLLVLALLFLLSTGLSSFFRSDARQVDIRRFSEDGFSGTLYRPRDINDSARGSGIVLVCDRLSQRRAAAMEFARRGWVCLSVRDGSLAAPALDFLLSQDYIFPDRVALVASGYDSLEALELAEERDVFSTTVLLTRELQQTEILAADSSVNNLLIFSMLTPEPDELAVFLGTEPHRARLGETFGYFGEGSARRAEQTLGLPTFRSEQGLSCILDWLGNSLGHRVSLPDSDQLWRLTEVFYYISAVSGILYLATGFLWLFMRVDKR